MLVPQKILPGEHTYDFAHTAWIGEMGQWGIAIRERRHSDDPHRPPLFQDQDVCAQLLFITANPSRNHAKIAQRSAHSGSSPERHCASLGDRSAPLSLYMGSAAKVTTAPYRPGSRLTQRLPFCTNNCPPCRRTSTPPCPSSRLIPYWEIGLRKEGAVLPNIPARLIVARHPHYRGGWGIRFFPWRVQRPQ